MMDNIEAIGAAIHQANEAAKREEYRNQRIAELEAQLAEQSKQKAEPVGFANGDRLARGDARHISKEHGAYYNTPIYAAPVVQQKAEPVAWLHHISDNEDREHVVVDFEPTHCLSVYEGDVPLYDAPVVPDGMVMVPKRPTPEMIHAAHKVWVAQGYVKTGPFDDYYKAMIAAAQEEA